MQWTEARCFWACEQLSHILPYARGGIANLLVVFLRGPAGTRQALPEQDATFRKHTKLDHRPGAG